MTGSDPYETHDTAADRHELPHEPAELVTQTGRHPAIVIKPEPRGRVALGLVVDAVALICVTVLIALGKVTAAEGLPWIGLLLGLKAKAMAGNGKPTKPPSSGGAILGLLGL